MSYPLIPLGQLAKFINGDRGKNYPSKDSFVDIGIPFINAGCLSDLWVLDSSKFNYISEEAYDRLSSGKIQKNDILFCLRGSVGKFAVIRDNNKGALASSLVILRGNDKVDIEYLKHYLASSLCIKELDNYQNGAAQPNLSANDFKKFLVPLPPLAEQRRIASILDQADELRKKRQQAIKKLDQLLKATFIDMFGDPVKNSRNIKETSLYEIAKIYTGKTPPSSKENMFNGEIPFITPGDLGNIITKSKRSLTLEGGAYSKIVPIGSTLVCCIGATIGKMGYASISCSFNQQINSITWGSQINPIFGYEMLKFYSGLISVKGASTTLPILKKSEFEKIKVIVPEMDSQIKFEEIAKLIWQQTEIQKSALNENKSLFNSLQQKAFNGTL